jgi:oxalate decarboxylase/phosphoglucose isomerase-like protein (cupin superfamily)
LKLVEQSRYKLDPDDFKSDRTPREDRDWLGMELRWLISEKMLGSQQTVVGRTIQAPGVGARRALHRRPNAEEWGYVIFGVGVKHVDDESSIGRSSAIAFIPKNLCYGLKNALEDELQITLRGYSGAPSLEKAGYIIREDETEGKAA